MAENIIKVRQKQRCDTEANWTSKNPVLLAGEIAISSDKNGLMKVGDGKSLWTAIPYSKASLSKTDVTTALGYTPPTTNTTYSIGTSSTAGIVKLYTGTGSNTDGTMTQLSIKTELDKKIVSSSLASGTDVFGKIPYIGNDGVCEMGKYIDLHFSNKESHDYTTRLLPEDTDGSLIIQPRVSTTCLTLRSPSGASYVKFMSGWNNLGWIGIESVNGPAVHYNSSGAKHRIYDSASITYGTSAPPSTAAAGDIYIQIS